MDEPQPFEGTGAAVAGTAEPDEPPASDEPGPGAVVDGSLRFDRDVTLYVHDSARIGPVSGANVLRFDADSDQSLLRIQDVFRKQLLALDSQLKLPF